MITTIHPRQLSLLLATVLAGLSAGFFYTYEASVTLALADVDDTTYVNTFQAINETIRNPAFGIMFLGTIPAIALAIALNWTTGSKAGRMLLAAAGAFYLATLFITGAGNVPLNDDLAEVANVTAASAATARDTFEDDWNTLNLLRAFTSGTSFLCLATAILLTPRSANA